MISPVASVIIHKSYISCSGVLNPISSLSDFALNKDVPSAWLDLKISYIGCNISTESRDIIDYK